MGVSRKFKIKVSRVFQECFDEVLFCNYVLACISSQHIDISVNNHAYLNKSYSLRYVVLVK